MILEREMRVIRLICPMVRRYSWWVLAIVITGVLSSLAEGVGISLFVPFVQSIRNIAIDINSNSPFIDWLGGLFGNMPDERRLLVVAGCIYGSILLKAALAYATHALFCCLDSRITHEIRSTIFAKLLGAKMTYLDSFRPGQLLSILSTETWRVGKAVSLVVWSVITCFSLLIYAGLLILISWQLTVLVSAIMLAVMCLVSAMNGRVSRLGEDATRINATLTSQMVEGLQGMKQIRAFVREGDEQGRFESTSHHISRTFLSLGLLGGLVNPLYELISGSVLVVIMLITLKTGGSLAGLLVFIFVLHRLMPKIRALDGCRLGLVTLAKPVEAAADLWALDKEKHQPSGTVCFKTLDQDIRFEHVNFAYSPHEPVLKDVSLTLPARKITALAGPSGAGKSTLVNLLFRFYDADSGRILIDGTDLRHLDLETWRRSIALVSQDTFLFNGTVRENIAYGRPDAPQSEIEKAARQADAHLFISELADGYETVLGTGGNQLSGGQGQRIALARAFLCEPEILVLDEATNALDTISERLVHDTLERFRGKRTVFVIAHRFSTVRQADHILTMDQGRICESGSLQHLMAKSGLFQRLYGAELNEEGQRYEL